MEHMVIAKLNITLIITEFDVGILSVACVLTRVVSGTESLAQHAIPRFSTQNMTFSV
jgi:hypothetical protein